MDCRDPPGLLTWQDIGTPKDRNVLYLGIHQILYPKSIFLAGAPSIFASGKDLHKVATATEARLSEQLELFDEIYLRAWVLKVNRLGSTPVREWTVAPTGLRLTSINQETGEVRSMVRDAEPDVPESNPRVSNPAPRFRPPKPMRLVPLSVNQPVFVGLRQSMQPESAAMVAAPEVLAIAERHNSVISEVKFRYSKQKELSTLCTFKFWVLEAHKSWSCPHEDWLVAPDGVETAEID